MQFQSALLFALTLGLAAASPAPASLSTLQQLNTQTIKSSVCTLPAPGKSCAGGTMQDVIVTYGTTATKEQRDLIIGAAKSSGSNIIYNWDDFGFSGFVPDLVVELIKTHGASFGLSVYPNACLEIPWCGEAPC